MLIPSWRKFREPQKVSEASLRVIRRAESERILQEKADQRHAQQDLDNKPQ